MAMKKHVTNEHGLDLVKYMAYKNDLEGKDGSKWQKCKQYKAYVTPITITCVFKNVKPYKNNVTQFRRGSLRILFWWLLRAICHCLLWIPLGWGEWCFVFVVKSNVLVNLFMNTFLLCYRKPWKFMCFLPLVNCKYDSNVWFMDVNVKLWHFCLDRQFHYPKLGSLSHNYRTI